MQYKTIVLEILKQNSELHAKLAASNSLLSTMNQFAVQLRENHQEIIQQLRKQKPESSDLQLSSEAMELAVQELQDSLPIIQDSNVIDPLSLDAAMAFLKRHTPPG